MDSITSIFATVLPIIFAIGLIVGVVYLVLKLAQRNIVKLNRQVELLATKFKLSFYPVEVKLFTLNSYPTAEGKIGSNSLRIHFYTTGSGKNTTYWSQVNMAIYNPSMQDFTIKKENFLTKIGKAFGGQDIEVGDEAFDKEFILKSKDEAFLQSLLDQAVRLQMKRVWLENRPAGTLELKGNQLVYKEARLINNEAGRRRLEEVVLLMAAFGAKLDSGDFGGQMSSDQKSNEHFF